MNHSNRVDTALWNEIEKDIAAALVEWDGLACSETTAPIESREVLRDLGDQISHLERLGVVGSSVHVVTQRFLTAQDLVISRGIRSEGLYLELAEMLAESRRTVRRLRRVASRFPHEPTSTFQENLRGLQSSRYEMLSDPCRIP